MEISLKMRSFDDGDEAIKKIENLYLLRNPIILIIEDQKFEVRFSSEATKINEATGQIEVNYKLYT